MTEIPRVTLSVMSKVRGNRQATLFHTRVRREHTNMHPKAKVIQKSKLLQKAYTAKRPTWTNLDVPYWREMSNVQ